MKRGKFIVVDGCEGAGKTSILAKARKHFKDSVLFTREPGGTPLGEEIRNILLHSEHSKEASPETQFSLFWAARAEHLSKLIIPEVSKGRNVITDRFDSATYAYQIVGKESFGLRDLFFETRDVILKDLEPDLYIFLDVAPEIGLERKSRQKGEILNHFDLASMDFHKKMREGFEEFFGNTGVPYVVIDASQSEEKVWEEFLEIVLKVFL